MTAAEYIESQIMRGKITYDDLAALIRIAQAAIGVAGDGKPGPATLAALRPRPSDAPDIITRARSAIGKGVSYGLGRGGYHPDDLLPARMTRRQTGGREIEALWCDCSGFIAWVLGRSREPSGAFKYWLSTDAIYHDARGEQKLFESITYPVPGCLAVYADYETSDGKHHQGHVAVVVDPDAHTVIDCSSTAGGITEHKQNVFWGGKHPVVWCVPR